MAIYRGPGGSGDAVNDSSSETRLAVEARDAALAAQAAAEAAEAAALTSETNAATSASNASTSATNASNSASAASTSATNAASSASSASTSATNAASSASSASTSATNAASSASSASTSATSASNSASAAATSATNAANSATAAQTAQAAAEAAFDAFDDIYLGAKSSNPTVDNDGNALTTGDQYFNTVSNELRVWNGSSWQAASTVGGTVSSLTVTGATALNGGATLGDASGDALTINSSAVSIPNGLNFDSNTFVIDATNNRVGIGQASPSTSLQITKGSGSTLRVNSTGANQIFAQVDNTTNTTEWGVLAAGESYISSNGAYSQLFYTNGSERMRITSTGAVGIGTSSPSYTATNRGNLNIAGSSGAILGFQMSGVAKGYVFHDGTNFQLWSEVAGPMLFATNALERMRIDSSGNVGIGTNSPATGYFLTVGAGTASTNGTIALNGGSDSNFGSGIAFRRAGTSKGFIGTQSWVTSGTSDDITLYAAASGALRFYSNGAQNAILDTSGNLGIGTSSPATKLDVNGSIQVGYTASGQSIIAYNGDTTNYQRILLTTSGTDGVLQATRSSGTVPNILFKIDATERMRLDSSGNLLLGKTTNTIGSKLNVNGTLSETVSSTEYLVASQYDIGTAPNKIPLNQYLGSMAYQNKEFISVDSLYSSGNVGIGTSSPSQKLEVAGSTVITGGVTGQGAYIYRDGASGGGVYTAQTGNIQLLAPGSTGVIQFNTNASEKMRLDSSGNLGLGVTPSTWDSNSKTLEMTGGALMPYSTSQMNLLQNAYYDGISYKYKNTAVATYYGQSGGAHKWFNAASGTAGNAISFTQAMTLDASGNLLVGATSSSSGITIERSGATSAEIKLNQTGASGRDFRIASTGSGYGSAGNLIFYDATAAAERMRIDSSGNLLTGGLTSSPGQADSNSTAGQVLALNTKRELRWYGTNASIYGGSGGVDDNLYYYSGNSHIWRTNGAERARIDISGNLLVGKTSSSSYPVQAKGGGLDGSTTVSVNSGVTTTIYTSPQTVTAMFCVVFGDNGSVGFCDLIIFLPSVTPTVVSSNSIYGSPAARTYSVASTTQLRVNVANNLSVRVAVLGTCTV